jgi:hypothetical protein
MVMSESLNRLTQDLHDVFGDRFRSLIAYEAAVDNDEGQLTLALVDHLTADDLHRAATRVSSWHKAGLATPLILGADEFARALDAFPFEFGAILAHHLVVSGADPFEGLRVDPSDLRRACEHQARSHLLHLREGYLEALGHGDAVAGLVRQSAAPLAALVQNVARLHGAEGDRPEAAAASVERALGLVSGSLVDVVRLTHAGSVPADYALRLFPPYLTAVERLTHHIDEWRSGA